MIANYVTLLHCFKLWHLVFEELDLAQIVADKNIFLYKRT